jgi:hypothetical protein
VGLGRIPGVARGCNRLPLWGLGNGEAGGAAPLNRFEDDVAVGGGVAGADESDGIGDELFKVVVGKAGDFYFGVEALEAIEFCVVACDDVGRIGGEKLLGLPDLTNFKIVFEDFKKLGNEGDAAREREVDHFDVVPVGEGPVGDDEGVGVANPRKEIVDGGIKNSFLEHGWRKIVRLIWNDQQKSVEVGV